MTPATLLQLTPRPRPTKKRATEKNLFLRGDTYYFRKQIKGSTRRQCVSTGCKDLDQARRRKVELEKELNDEGFGWTKKAPAPLVLDWLRECLTTYGPSMQGRAFANGIALGERFWQEMPTLPARINEVLPLHCTQFLNWMAGQDFARNTIRNRAGVLRLVWNHAIAADKAAKNPWKGLKLPKGQPRKRVVLPHEQARLLAALKPAWRRIAEFAILTGLRHDELLKLRDADVDVRRQHVHVRHGKGGKERFVPLVPEAAALIKAQITTRDAGTMGVRVLPPTAKRIAAGYIFPFSVGALLAAIAQASTDAKLAAPSITVHDLRRTFGTRCANSGVPMKKLQEWMGHASIAITARFYVVNDDDITNDIKLMAGLRASVTKEVQTPVVT